LLFFKSLKNSNDWIEIDIIFKLRQIVMMEGCF
jgi:hypothetical protein